MAATTGHDRRTTPSGEVILSKDEQKRRVREILKTLRAWALPRRSPGWLSAKLAKRRDADAVDALQDSVDDPDSKVKDSRRKKVLIVVVILVAVAVIVGIVLTAPVSVPTLGGSAVVVGGTTAAGAGSAVVVGGTTAAGAASAGGAAAAAGSAATALTWATVCRKGLVVGVKLVSMLDDDTRAALRDVAERGDVLKDVSKLAASLPLLSLVQAGIAADEGGR